MQIDYTKLRDLLAAGKWKEADEETLKVMCQAAGKKEPCYLDIEDIEKFPCEDLRTIDQLWLHYSDEKFGLSVQKKIYESLERTGEYNEGVWEKFGDRVGWRKGGKWLHYSKLSFDKSASEGHLPVKWWGLTEYLGGITVDEEIHIHGWISSLAQRLVTCKI